MAVGIHESRQVVPAMAATTQSPRVLDLVRQKRIVRATELDRLGIHRMHIKRLVAPGLLVQRSRGVCGAAKPRMSEHAAVHRGLPARGVVYSEPVPAGRFR